MIFLFQLLNLVTTTFCFSFSFSLLFLSTALKWRCLKSNDSSNWNTLTVWTMNIPTTVALYLVFESYFHKKKDLQHFFSVYRKQMFNELAQFPSLRDPFLDNIYHCCAFFTCCIPINFNACIQSRMFCQFTLTSAREFFSGNDVFFILTCTQVCIINLF